MVMVWCLLVCHLSGSIHYVGVSTLNSPSLPSIVRFTDGHSYAWPPEKIGSRGEPLDLLPAEPHKGFEQEVSHPYAVDNFLALLSLYGINLDR